MLVGLCLDLEKRGIRPDMKIGGQSTFRLAFLLGGLLIPLRVCAIQITEVMYHPPINEARNEWVEIFNETSTRREISGWAFAEGIDFVFPPGTVLDPGEYLVIAADPAHISATYGITNVLGPFGGRLDNSSDHVILFDLAGGIIAEVDYEDGGRWPVGADGAGHSLSKRIIRGNPMDPDNWSTSNRFGGTPGRDNGFRTWYEDTDIISVGDTWRYYKGYGEASTPVTLWRQIGFGDSGWLQGPTGIGYGDNDDATVLNDMSGGYWSIFCRKTFTIADPSSVENLVLSINYDDGFVAYLNGSEVARSPNMPAGPIAYNTQPNSGHEAGAFEAFDITAFKNLLVSGPNVLAVQVHNGTFTSSDLSFIPSLMSRVVHQPGDAASPIVVNEVSFNTSGTQYIELFNKSAAPIDVGGYYLSNDPDRLNLFRIPSPTVLPGNGFATFQQGTVGFSITSAGDRILLTSPSLDAVIDARAVEAGPKDFTEGRWPDGADKWYYMNPTTNTANIVVLNSAVVINEIMYHPPSDLDADEYVELYNTGATAVDLTGWRFSRGIGFDFTTGTTIAPGQYLVIAKDRDRLIVRYGLNPAIVLGNYTGRLGNGDEKIRLRDANNNVADEVHYYDDGHWSQYADGYGSSLELIDPGQDNSNYQAWAPSDETAASPWVTYSYSGVVNTVADVNEHELHLHLMGPGVVLIDDIELRRGATQYIANGTFEGGIGNWLVMGNHIQSHVTTDDAYNGSRSLKVIATGRGDTSANHIEQNASIAMPSGQTYTISFAARWLWGNPVLVTRCWDNQAPETHMLPVPSLTGTPGAQNSVYRANMGPVVRDVAHAPVIPGPTDPLRITARVSDPHGVSNVTVYYKSDPSPTYQTAQMWDDGAHLDGAAGDGVYGATAPAPGGAGQTVAFYLQATDGLGAAQSWPSDISRPALYRIENSPLSSSFPTYRVVMTSAEESELFNRPHPSNEPLNCTFVFDEKDVYYNCGVRFVGSPYGRRTGYRGYKVIFNADEKLHGVKWQARFDKGQNGGYRDRLAYHMLSLMGVPYCLTEFHDVRVNARAEGIHEDILPPGKRFLDTFYRGDDEGQIFEMSAHYRYTADVDTDLTAFDRFHTTWTDLGDDKDQYRWYYRLRNHDRDDDYTTMIATVKLVGSIPGGTTQDEVAGLIDIIQWFRGMAVRSVNSDWDFVGTGSSKNAYMYMQPSTGLWQLLHWDCEHSFDGPTQNLYATRVVQMAQFQRFGGNHHYYLNAIHEYFAKHFTNACMDPWIDHYYATVGGYSATTAKTFVTDRRNYVQGQLNPYLLPNVALAITTPGPLTVSGRTADLQGTAPVNASYARVNGREYWLDWSDATHWSATIEVPPGTNLVTLEFLDYDHQLIGTASITISAPGSLDVGYWKQY